jgi:hypothetical protein
MLTLLATLALTLLPIQGDSAFAVAAPRISDAGAIVDGVLQEAVWQRAAVLRGFWQYLPVDGRPAGDSTVVRVWYSPTALHLGIRAWQDSASVRATMADRDQIAGDDHLEILLDTFNGRREAMLFGVNPFGVQSDGMLRDAAQRGASMTSASVGGAYAADLSQDFVFESKGRVTGDGYSIEIRIPFKTLRYPATAEQDWGINVIRRVRASGQEHTWTRVLQSNASFLAQGGTLTGLTGMRRGLVMDLIPEATSTVAGGATPAGWTYTEGSPQVGINARWGITTNITLNGTANPDFSQVEADVAQLVFDPREALYFPEKRPFFLDGLELFRTPVQLIYPRRLADPVAAAKLTGQLSGNNVALLSGVDSREVSRTGDDSPIYNLVRLRRDIGAQSTLGLAYTDKMEGDAFNRVAAADGRLRLGRSNVLTFQGGGSVTRRDGVTTTAPFWYLAFNRSGRSTGLTVNFRGFHDDFRAASGFVSRVGIAYFGISPSYTTYGAPDATLQRWTGNILLDGRWDYDRFFQGEIPNDPRLHFNTAFTFRGGWEAGASLLLESFSYPPELYAGYAIERTVAGITDTVPYAGTPRLSNLDVAVNLSTPRGQRFAGSLFLVVGRDENFYEWAPATIVIGTLDAAWRPSEQVRVNLLYNHQQYIRPADGSTVGMRRVSRLKVEYQLTRAVFVRLVGQYDADMRDSLRDNSRTELPVLTFDPTLGRYVRAGPESRNDLRVDWLFSYRPSPGTVLFAGYGSSLGDAGAFAFRDLARRNDGFFLKLSYVLRL